MSHISIRIILALSAIGLTIGPAVAQSKDHPELDRRARLLVDNSMRFSFQIGTVSYAAKFDGDINRAGSYKSLEKVDLRPYDLVTTAYAGEYPPYSDKLVEHLRAYVENGGGLIVFARPGSDEAGVHKLLKPLGLKVSSGRANRGDARVVKEGWPELDYPRIGGGYMVEMSEEWEPIVKIADQTVIAARDFGRGRIIVSGIFAICPDYRHKIWPEQYERKDRSVVNDEFAEKLFLYAAEAMAAETSKKFVGYSEPEMSVTSGNATFYYPEVIREEAQYLVDNFERVRYLIFYNCGARNDSKMNIIALTTGGAGWTASASRIGIGAVGGDDMKASVLCHEFNNSMFASKLIPSARLWWGDAGWSNINTRRVKLDLGGESAEEARSRTARYMRMFREQDPTGREIDLFNWYNIEPGRQTALRGKLEWMIEQLEEKYGEDFIRRYWRWSSYYYDTANETALRNPPGSQDNEVIYRFSLAAGESLFDWFAEHGTSVEKRPVMPIVTDTWPRRDAKMVPVDTEIVLGTNEPLEIEAIRPEALSESAVRLELREPGSTEVLLCEYSYDPDRRQLTVKPARPLPAGKKIAVVVRSPKALSVATGQPLDGNGSGLAEERDDFELVFTTRPAGSEASKPVFTPPGENLLKRPAGGTVVFSVDAEDPDGASLCYKAENIPEGADFDPYSRIFHWRTDQADAGRHVVQFSADNGSEKSIQTLTIELAEPTD